MFENGFHPIDALRERLNAIRAHPFQEGASAVAGFFGGPIGGGAARAGFNRYNDYSLNHAQDINQSRVGDQMQMDTNDAMNRPLEGPLGWDGMYIGGGEQGNQALAQALSGSGSGGGFGGPAGGQSYGSPGGYNMAQGFLPSAGYDQGGSTFVSGLMNELPGGSGFGSETLWSTADNGGSPLTHQQHLDNLDMKKNSMFGADHGLGGNYGISNMTANGQQMITGYMPDMNQKYLKGK